MPHDVALIATIAIGFAFAFIFGLIAHRLGLPPLVGYLVAGVVVGPTTPGFVADSAMAGQLAEIGVMLLMFGVGLHFSIADLIAVRRIAIPGAIGQIVIGPRVVPWMLRQVARTGSRELFTLCVLAVALGIAFGSAKLFGVSFALGAFFAGMVLNESDLSHKAATNSLPRR
jgi:predicted Kef-type K+ transport protein